MPGKNNIYDTIPASAALAVVVESCGRIVRIHLNQPIPYRLGFLDIEKYIFSEKSNNQAWDAIISLGLSEKEKNEMRSKFPAIPILNIEGQESNSKRSSAPNMLQPRLVSERLARILKDANEDHITPKVATALLASIVASTQNFKKERTHSGALFTSAFLVSKNGSHETIVQNMYKTKPLGLIRLWGSAVKNFNYIEEKKIKWGVVEEEDIKTSQATQNHIVQIINELKNNDPQANIFVLGVKESYNRCYVIVHSKNYSDIKKISLMFGSKIQNSSIALPVHSGSSISEETFKLIQAIQKIV